MFRFAVAVMRGESITFDLYGEIDEQFKRLQDSASPIDINHVGDESGTYFIRVRMKWPPKLDVEFVDVYPVRTKYGVLKAVGVAGIHHVTRYGVPPLEYEAAYTSLRWEDFPLRLNDMYESPEALHVVPGPSSLWSPHDERGNA